ncbi:MAG: lysophospholipid acyltransferase family protein [Acidimicrobiales bacterium]
MFYGLIKVILTPVLRGLFRLRVVGAENVAPSGPVILAANHQAFCDSLFIPLVVGRRVTFVAKAEYFESWKTNWFLRAVGQIPMNRQGGEAANKSLGEALSHLQGGGCLGIYPEGTRPPDERLHKGRTGIARLALAARCPVVPVGVKGTREIQPIGARILRPFKTVEITFGEPIDLAARYCDPLDDSLVFRQATDEVMWEIGLLSGQQYIDRYASRRPQGAEEPPGAGAEGPASPAPIRLGSGERVLADSA